MGSVVGMLERQVRPLVAARGQRSEVSRLTERITRNEDYASQLMVFVRSRRHHRRWAGVVGVATLGNGAERYAKPGAGIKLHKGMRAIDGTTVFDGNMLSENSEIISKGHAAVAALAKLISHPRCNAHRQLQLFRKYSYDIIQYHFMYQDLVDAVNTEHDRILGKADRSRKRWTQEEDSLLVELACKDDSTSMTIAIQLGRTPGAVQTRLSYLVGINRISSHIAGRFVGWLNDEYVDGEIDGTLTQDAEVV